MSQVKFVFIMTCQFCLAFFRYHKLTKINYSDIFIELTSTTLYLKIGLQDSLGFQFGLKMGPMSPQGYT